LHTLIYCIHIVEALTAGRVIPSGTCSMSADVSTQWD